MNENRVKLDSKMQLLEGAKRVFARKGFERSTLIEITKEAGVQNKLIVYQFKGKDGLLSAVFQTFLPLSKIIWRNEINENPVDWLKKVIHEIVLLREKDPEILSILQSEISFSSIRGDLVDFYISSIWKEFRDVLVAGRSRGYFQFGSLELTLSFVISSIFMYKKEFQTNNKFFSIDITTKETIGLVLSALNCPARGNKSLDLQEVSL